jgi:hypothetical protein
MRAPKKAADEKRPWRVFLMCARAQELGVVYAPDQAAAEAAAIEKFKIGEDQRNGSLIRCRPSLIFTLTGHFTSQSRTVRSLHPYFSAACAGVNHRARTSWRKTISLKEGVSWTVRRHFNPP